MTRTVSGKRGKRAVKFVLAAVAVLLSALFASLAFSAFFEKTVSDPSFTLTDSGSSHTDITAAVSGVYLSGFDPCIKLRWKNNSDGRCIYGAEYDVMKESREGVWESTLTDIVWDTPAFILEKGGEKEEKYPVSASSLPDGGSYRFETWFYTEKDGIKSERHTVFIEFTLKEGVTEGQSVELEAQRIIYDNLESAEAVTPEALPRIKIAPDMTLFLETADGWETAGVFSEIRLSKENFDSRIWHSGVIDQISAVDVRAENKRAWQIYRESGTPDGTGQLYVLLEQADGSIFFAEGEYNTASAVQENRDRSYFRYIFSTEAMT